MNENYYLSLKTGLSVDHEIEIVLSGLKESLVVLESIDEKRTFFGLNNGLAGLFQQKISYFVMLKKGLFVFRLNLHLINFIILIDQAQL